MSVPTCKTIGLTTRNDNAGISWLADCLARGVPVLRTQSASNPLDSVLDIMDFPGPGGIVGPWKAGMMSSLPAAEFAGPRWGWHWREQVNASR